MASLNLITPARDETSSASSSHVYSPFDVFINHRGPDVKKGLASHLYSRLKDRGLRVFLDVGELQQGDEISSQIRGAIRTASVHVAIFSARYAESSWCLNELVMMLESGSTIIPVFHDVNPSELRWTRNEDGVYARALSIVHCILPCIRAEDGGYARALYMLEKKTTIDSQTNRRKPRYDSNTVERWRKALSDVSYLSGFELNACNGDEGRLTDLVVQQVLKKVSKTPLNVAKYPTGLDDKVKEFETTMLSQQKSGNLARVVGIVGLGGVGKSTLAKEFFNRHRSDYVRHCFVSDVRENAARNSLNSLQSILLNDLANSDTQINTVDEGIGKLKRYLSSGQRALLVLDNVDHVDQLDALLSPVKDTIHPDSLILVTSRNRDVLISSDIPESSIYRLTGLNRQHSRKLFCSHAFGPSHSLEGFDKVIDQFLVACQGLPLSLKVVGALLRGKRDLNHWKAQLRKISKILPEDIQSTLKIGYDSLDKWEKQIFLDIACFFIGEDKDRAIRIWNGSGWEGGLGLWTLENRCLVDVDSENCIIMHDHLRDFGRELAENEHPGCRLWRPTDKLLHDLSGQSPVRGISMVNLNDSEQSFENLAGGHLFTNMSSLQLLRAEGYFVERVLSVRHLPQLIYLRWDNCPSSSLPSSVPLKNLRVLYLQGQYLETLWNHESQAPSQLRELNIVGNLLKIIPNSIGKLKHLEKLVLHGRKLETLTDSVGNLTSLQSLDLCWCFALKMLPDSIGEMTSLQSLVLCGCSALQMLPESVGKMTKLQSFNLCHCCALQMLPDSIGKMTSLQSLNLYQCSVLQMLPDSVGKLTSLHSLNLGQCTALQMLPDSVGKMMNLQRLDLYKCVHLQMLPDSIGEMTSLQSLDLGWCFQLRTLPYSIGKMTSLQSLDLTQCYSLQMLPESVGKMTSLQSLVLYNCSALKMLPDSIGEMTSLQNLDLTQCYALHMLPESMGKMTSLQSLVLYTCSALKMLPDSIGEMTSLQSLVLRGCSALQKLPGSFGKMTNLQSLDLGNCSALEMLPDSIGEMTILQSLELEGCSTLQMLPDSVGKMKSLESLKLCRCSALQRLPDSVGKMTSLQSLDLRWCSTLQMLPDSFGEMTNLRSLNLGWCSALEMLPNSIGKMKNLHSLNLNWCSVLEKLPDSVGQMRSLKNLRLYGCSASE